MESNNDSFHLRNEWINIDKNGRFETKKEIKVHEGYFGTLVYQGGSHDPKYKRYPAWRLYIKVPEFSVIKSNGFIEVRITPGYSKMETFLKDILVHELRVDSTRHRKSDFPIKRRWLKDLVWDKLIQEAQTEINNFEFPKIYTQCMDLSDYGKVFYGVI